MSDHLHVIHIVKHADGERAGRWTAYRADEAILGVEETLSVWRNAFGRLHRGAHPEPDHVPSVVPETHEDARTRTQNGGSVYWTSLPEWGMPVPDPEYNDEEDLPATATYSAVGAIDYHAAEEFGADAPDGIYRGVPAAEYLNHPALSRSVVAEGARYSAEHARHKWKNSEPVDASSKATELGTALHTRILEPEVFASEYDVAPEVCSSTFKSGDPCTYSAKHRVAGKWYCGRHVPDGPTDDIYTLKASDMEKIEGMESSIRSNEEGSLLLDQQDGLNELVVLWTDEVTGVRCKARLDRLVDVTTTQDRRPNAALVDIKTARSAHPDDFRRSIAQYGYWAQPTFYGMGLDHCSDINVKDFVFIVVESSPPHTVACYRLGAWTQSAARARVNELLDEIADSIESDHWRTYGEGVQPIGMKRYELERLGLDTDQ
jgi:hypothetical protein